MQRPARLALFLTTLAAGAAPPGRPNLLLILADDLGYSDLGCYGGEIATPHLDRLALDGLRFRQAYNCAVCVSTRASLLTGLYPQQAGFEQRGGALSPAVPTVAEILRTAGYRTYLSGKWHLGSGEGRRPRARGFDRHFGILDGASNYFKHATIRPTPVYLDDVRLELPEDFYMTDAITDHAVDFLRAGAGTPQPFFLYLAYTAPHFPLHAKPADIARYRGGYLAGWDVMRAARYRRQVELGLFGGRWPLTARPELARDPPWSERNDRDDWDLKMAVYAAQVHALDRGVGRVLNALNAIGAADNTLVVFLSDNGAAASNLYETEPGRKAAGVPAGPAGSYTAYGLHWANVSSTPFTLYKTWTHEGGISTPLIARWPGRVKDRGGFTDEVVHVMDIAATFLDAAGARYPAAHRGQPLGGIEGKSFLSTLRGERREAHATLAWSLYGNHALRRGDWKLVRRSPEHLTSSFGRWRYDPAPAGGQWELYHLPTDRTESRDRAGDRPDLVRELAAAYETWNRRVTASVGPGVDPARP